MLKEVRVSDRLRILGIRENHRGFPTAKSIRVFGADTETVKGKLHTFQIASEGETVLRYTNPERGFGEFCRWLDARALVNGVNLVFIHVLKFDATVLLEFNHQEIYDQFNEVTLSRDGFDVRMFYGRVNFLTIRRNDGLFKCGSCGELPRHAVRLIREKHYCANPRHGEPTPVKRVLGPVIRILDSSAFCPPGGKSLASALKIYAVPYKKMDAPEGLGERALSDPYFERYAMNDALAEEALGVSIVKLHKEYDITPCVSLPQLAGRILRHHFFRPGERFQFPPEECRIAAEFSYHAGKNGFYAKPGVYENLYEYDINSAFPCAMRAMPQMVKGEYVYVKRAKRDGEQRYLGIYRVSGRRIGGRYPLVFDHLFRPVSGEFEDTWITGYELELLAKSRDYHYTVKDGWIWRHDPNYGHSPLGDFVDNFWKLKSEAPKGPKRDTYKNILNSLYGKFAACVEQREVVPTAFGKRLVGSSAEKYFVSGALYHPFIATQITGYVRAKLYELELSGHALHAATDSIKSPLDLPSGEGLGGIKKEVYGRCFLFRNKLYLHFAKDNALCGHNLTRGWLPVYKEETLADVGNRQMSGKTWDADTEQWWGKLFEPDGQHLCKYGLHGFKGSAFLLYQNRDRLLREGYLDYQYDHMTQLREAFSRGEAVCTMVRRSERLNLNEKVAIAV